MQYNKLFFVLYPLGIIYEWVYRIRRYLYKIGFYKATAFDTPIISVGNIAFGGTGKTPFTLWLAKKLEEEKKKVLILSRGHKGKYENSVGLLTHQNHNKNIFEYGDEAALLFTNLKNTSVLTGRNRVKNLGLFLNEERPEAVLLDDGFQHLKLHRDLNIVLFNALMPYGQYRVPPLGYLREGRTALKEADCLVIGRADLITQKRMQKLKSMLSRYTKRNVIWAEFSYIPSKILNLKDEQISLEFIRGKKILALTAIASPKSFYAMMTDLGGVIVERKAFSDHYFYTEQDVEKLLVRAKEQEAVIFTTEKDIVKLKSVTKSENIFYIKIDLKFSQGERELLNAVKDAIKEND